MCVFVRDQIRLNRDSRTFELRFTVPAVKATRELPGTANLKLELPNLGIARYARASLRADSTPTSRWVDRGRTRRKKRSNHLHHSVRASQHFLMQTLLPYQLHKLHHPHHP
ncbi:hypothetical protein PGT21_035426 [Puccinia graminis f. sp. tritici]|uniref:Uncharacterized protein n=1 Tax=Puccinia graminis f. sp. tritici TaxID=56615 RepID=A0A5B0PI95_PUCGR|nr:hypothetical protein PGT21_035426 [Puccinia graminis f. sp. tritici]KAA1100290.1 hypothetical protein PGTUg99_009835 [Puccinia graminis f. sp. tritici]